MKTPFLWSGSKDRSYNDIRFYIPRFVKYAEPFLGGGAIYFRLLAERGIFPAFCSDINSDLIATYEVMRDNPNGLITGLPPEKDKIVFQTFLKSKPNSKVDRAIRFLYLNRNRFFGMGGWMVADRYAREAVADRIQYFSPLMQKTSFIDSGCWDIPLGADIFYFCDPPYPDTNNSACYANPDDDIHQLNRRYFAHLMNYQMCDFFWVTKFSEDFKKYVCDFPSAAEELTISKKEWAFRKPQVGVQKSHEIYVSRLSKVPETFLLAAE